MSRAINTVITGLAIVAIFFVAAWALVQALGFIGEVLKIYATPY